MNIEDAFESLRRSFESDRLAHGYVIEGAPRGGAGEVALRFLQILFCESSPRPCDTCRNCRQVRTRSLPDIMWIEPQKKSRMISVDQIRALQNRMAQTSYGGGWKAGVLVAADRLGVAAANAFLKTLEEPPGRGLFLLLTDSPQFLLPTISSRCQRLQVSGDEAQVAPELRDSLVDALTLPMGEGALAALGRADTLAALLKGTKDIARREVDAAAEEEGVEETDEVLDARANARYREVRQAVMRFVLAWYRDILLLRSGVDAGLVQHQAYLSDLKRMARGLSMRQAQACVQAVEAMYGQMERNVPEGSALVLGFSRMSAAG